MPAKISLPGKITVANAEEKTVSIVGYTGVPVDLTDYGFPEKLVYDLEGYTIANNIPYTAEHEDLMGHTIKNSKTRDSVTHIAKHTVDSEVSTTVYNAIVAGEPYEASMDAEILLNDVVFIENGTVEVNNQIHQAPIFVSRKGRIVGITATKSGRDSNTTITKLSNDYEEGKELLMLVKNSKAQEYLKNYPDAPAVLVQNAKDSKWDEETFKTELSKVNTPSPEVSVEYLLDYMDDSDATALIPNARKEKWEESKFKSELLAVKNAKPAPPTPGQSFDYLFEHFGDKDAKVLIPNAKKEGWDKDKFEAELAIAKVQNSYPGLPGVNVPHRDNGSSIFEARLAMGLGLSEETLLSKCGEKVLEQAGQQGEMGLKESLMICANANGGRFNGHSDAVGVAKHVKKLVRNSAFSTIDFPNIMHKITMWKLEEAWKIEEPEAPSMCKTVSTSDFRKHGHLKPRGGKMWEGLDQEGKLTNGTMGKEDKYETELDTMGQIVTFKREDIINDDIGWIQEALDLMLEGALMIPDYQLVNLIYGAAAAGVTTNGVSAFTLALTETNLSTVYKAVRRRRTSKEAADGDKLVNGRFNTRWNLVVSPDLEEEAWNILKQDRIVSNTTANTKQGDKNYWFNRLDIKTFDNLDNTTYNSDANNTTWMLLPQKEQYMPFYIRYLNRQTRPITETVELPADELGFGVRGYWDVNLGYRPVEDNKLQAYAFSDPS